MPVFNDIAFDGRAQRAAEALSEAYDITIFALDSGRGYSNPKFAARLVSLSLLNRFPPLAHFYFWLRLLAVCAVTRPAIVHAHDIFTAFPGWVAARITRARLVYDAHELIIPQPDFPLSLRSMLFYRLERWAVRRADMVIACNLERAGIMKEHYGLKKTPIVVRNIPPASKEALGTERTILTYPQLRREREDLVRLVYQGDVSLERGVGAFILAMSRLDERFQLALVGNGPDLGAITERVASRGLQGRVILLGKVSRAHLHDILLTCDIGVVTYPMKGLNNIYCAPNKLYEYAQAGLPVIATCQPPLRSMVNDYRLGLVVGCGDGDEAGEIADAAINIARDLAEYKTRIPDFLRENTWETERDKLLDAYRLEVGS